MNRIDDITVALRSLDPADRHVDSANARARADLQAILATDPAPARQHPSSPSRPVAGRPRSARATRRVALVGGVAAAVTTAVVLLPALTGGDQAFATWTPTPAGMTVQESADAAAECRQTQEEGPGTSYADELGSAAPVIAERRGVWTTVVLAGTDGFSALCITDDSAHLFARGMIGSIGTPADYAAPGPRDLVASDLGMGTMGAGDISLAAGTAGSDVVGVVFHSPDHGEVAATVSQGHFALWLPGDALDGAARNGVEVEVTYRDGSTGTSRLHL
ncbi:hypothetical protein [Georgenia subflava]|uniref:Uncharacterized protein n=1 Tax=Georgenia subflava TaxID=1622177 RepID=A0A6N7EKQ9_9MICO|nr:hypothetical protein [Georgenia subflava]MPV35864.1 hypothetical protein [Georgenia subflava]